MPDEYKKKLLQLLKGWGLAIMVALLVATSFKSAIADWYDIPSGSMKPTILIGDRIFVNKLAYDLKIPFTTLHVTKWAGPTRGDIVVFFSPKDGKRLIKRVIGLPGDTIALRKNQLFINGQSIKYESLNNETIDTIQHKQQLYHLFFSENLSERKHAVMFSPSSPSVNTFGPVTVPEGRYFMLGDNRDNSADSRFFGFVERKFIVGRAKMVVLSREGSFMNPRWDRLFKDLS